MLRVPAIIALLVTSGLAVGKSLFLTFVLIAAAIVVSTFQKIGDAENFVAATGLVAAAGFFLFLLV